MSFTGSLQIKTPAQLEAAFAFLASTASENLKVHDFEEACGVGKNKSTFVKSKYIIFMTADCCIFYIIIIGVNFWTW